TVAAAASILTRDTYSFQDLAGAKLARTTEQLQAVERWRRRTAKVLRLTPRTRSQTAATASRSLMPRTFKSEVTRPRIATSSPAITATAFRSPAPTPTTSPSATTTSALTRAAALRSVMVRTGSA